jgi:hypothetical protein
MSDYFFYDINKKMADLAKKQQLTENAAAAPAPKSKLTEAAADYSAKKAAAGKDIGKPGKNFSKIAAGAAKRYGSAEAGKRVAGAVLNKLRHPSEGVDESALSTPISKAMKSGGTRSLPGLPMQPRPTDESAFQAAIGKKKYGDQGMKALQKAGRDHAGAATMNKIRNQYDKYDESMTDEAWVGHLDPRGDRGGDKADAEEYSNEFQLYNPHVADKKRNSELTTKGFKRAQEVGDRLGDVMRRNEKKSAHSKTMGGRIKSAMGMTDEGNAFSGAVARAKADGVQPGEKIRVGGKQYPVREESNIQAHLAKYSPDMHDRIKNATDDQLYSMAQGFGGDQHSRVDHEYNQLHKARHHLSGPEGAGARRVQGVQDRFNQVMHRKTPRPDNGTMHNGRKIHEADATPQDVASYKDEVKAVNAPQRTASAPRPPVLSAKPVTKARAPVYGPGDMEGATAPPAKGKDGQYPIVTSGPHKGKRWSPTTPGPTNPTMKETGGIPTTPKQKSFAKLAPPVDKITFADRIVGAKKEVDEVLGDVAANAMKKAVGQIDWTDDDRGRRRSSSGGRVDTTTPGVTRHSAGQRYSGAGHDVSGDNEPTGELGRRRVGAGQGKKIGAKINRGTSKLMTREGDMPEDMIEPQDSGEYDREGEMAKDDIKTVVRHAQALEKILGDNDNLPEWVQAKLAKIEGMMTAVDDYMQNQKSGQMGSSEMDEESTNKRDSRAERAGKRVAKDIEYDEKKKDGIHGKRRDSEDDKAEKAGKKVAKDIEYDEKKDKKKDDKKEVDETTTSGSVATGGSAPKSGGGHNYGKGIYDSLNRKLENMISESMNINMSMNNDDHGGPRKSLTVTATDEDAVMLAGLLKMAGMGQDDDHIHSMTGDDSDMDTLHDIDHMHGDEPCADCGSSPCGCEDEMMDEAYGDTDASENEPDWPTDEEGTEDAMMYSGGLNGPKSTGQTTIPVIAGQNDRMGHAGDHELRRMMEIAGLR